MIAPSIHELPVQQPPVRRKEILRGDAGRELADMPVDHQCRRCGMSQDDHTQFGKGKLQLHHLVAIRDGGHPSDPSNLHTLCYFCHQEWHTWWEGKCDWLAFMAASPYWKLVKNANFIRGPLPPTVKPGCCRLCGITAQQCAVAREGRTSIRPFERVPRAGQNLDIPVCHWCQREWEIFWRSLRPDAKTFFRVPPFRLRDRIVADEPSSRAAVDGN